MYPENQFSSSIQNNIQKMSLDLGVHYGGSSMQIAYVRDENRSIIVNETGDRWTPSIFAVNDTEFSVGLPAKQNMIRNSQNTVLHSKHYLSNDLNKVQENIVKKNQCQVKMNDHNELVFSLQKEGEPFDLTLTEVVEKQIQFLADLARSSMNAKELKTVLSVPCYFTEEETQTLKKCAEKVGFHVLRVIKNPVAACLAYDIEEDNTSANVSLVYQLGGNSVEVSLVSLNNGLYRIIDSKSIKNVGGDNFTDLIADICADEFKRKNRCNPKENKRSVSKLKSSAEDLKHILSTMERAHCTIDALFEGIDFDYYLNRQRFEAVCGRLYEQVLAPIDELLAANNVDRINQVILVGAATKMCKLQSLIKTKFDGSKILNTQSPDEIIALGCAKQCALISNSKHMKEIQNTDLTFKCTSKPIFLKNGSCPDYIKICQANAPFPIRRNYSLNIDLADPILTLQESEGKEIAKINLKEFKTKAITFSFNIKMNGQVEVSVTEVSCNKKLTAILNEGSA